MHKIMAQRGNNEDNENFELGPPRHAGGNGTQGINFVWPYCILCLLLFYISFCYCIVHNVLYILVYKHMLYT